MSRPPRTFRQRWAEYGDRPSPERWVSRIGYLIGTTIATAIFLAIIALILLGVVWLVELVL